MLHPDRLSHVTALARAHLDRLDAVLPPRRTPLPFTEYMARAALLARTDPEFAARWRQSTAVYQLLAQHKEYP